MRVSIMPLLCADETETGTDCVFPPRPGQHPADSWTAVGTLLDLDTLNVVCRQEQLGSLGYVVQALVLSRLVS